MGVTFSFNGITMPELSILKEESRPMIPPIRTQTFGVSNRNGAYLGRQVMEPRVIRIPIGIIHRGFAQLQQIKEQMAGNFFTDGQAAPLVFSDEPNRVYHAVLTAGFQSADESANYTKGALEFTCFDPFKYSAVARTVNAGQIFNNGTVAALPVVVVRFTSNQTNFFLRDAITGRELRVNWEFRTGDVLIIDSEKRRLTINHVLQMSAFDFTSHWPELISGATHLTASHQAEITFRERWY